VCVRVCVFTCVWHAQVVLNYEETARARKRERERVRVCEFRARTRERQRVSVCV